MTPEPRITLAMNDGELNIYVNESGRELLIKELTGLSRRSESHAFRYVAGGRSRTPRYPLQFDR